MDKMQKEQDRINGVYNSYKNDRKFRRKWTERNYGNKCIGNERRKTLIKLINKQIVDLEKSKILEIGCASGGIAKLFIELGAKEDNIHGIDIRSQFVEGAKIALPNATFSTMDARKLEFPDNSFEIVITFTLFSSIKDNKIKEQIASEIYRVLKHDGILCYYDFRYNNPFNKHVKRIRKSEIRKLFPDLKGELKLITLIPLFVRKLGKFNRILYPVLSTFPFLRTHYIGSLVKLYSDQK